MAGRIRNPGTFVMLVPRALDPVEAGARYAAAAAAAGRSRYRETRFRSHARSDRGRCADAGSEGRCHARAAADRQAQARRKTEIAAQEAMSRRRSVSDDERALWANVTRSIAPLRPRVRLPAAPLIDRAEPAPKATRKAAPPRVAPSHVAPPVKAPPPLAPLGRRLKQRVARGREPIDARIDLHGFTQAQAHAALLRFLHRAQADDVQNRAGRDGKRRARWRRRTRRAQAAGADVAAACPSSVRYIVGFEDAHIGHGGEGALYVRLRRPAGRHR